MDIFGILDPDPQENLCGSETLGSATYGFYNHPSELPILIVDCVHQPACPSVNCGNSVPDCRSVEEEEGLSDQINRYPFPPGGQYRSGGEMLLCLLDVTSSSRTCCCCSDLDCYILKI